MVLAAALLVAGCGRAEVIPEKDMTEIYVDMFIADQWLRDHDEEKERADTTLFFDPVFRKYGYTFEDYDKSVSYYVAHPDKFSDITVRVAEELKKRADQMRELWDKSRTSSGYETQDFSSDTLWASFFPVRDSLTSRGGEIEIPLTTNTY